MGTKTCVSLAKSVDKGSEYNVEANTIVYMSQPPVGIVSCVNESPFTGGRDEEDDETLRARILGNYSALPNGANTAFYEKEALSVSGVTAVKVIRRKGGSVRSISWWRGQTAYPPRTDKLRREQNRHVEGICVDVDVYAPTPVTVNISLKLDVENGYSFNATTILVARALTDYFNGTLLGKDILMAKLGSIVYGVRGVRNYSFQSPTQDITVDDDELPVLGNLAIAEWK